MQRAVCLASGGLDSVVCLNLLHNNDVIPLPIFVDYGQLNRDRELSSLKRACKNLNIEAVEVVKFPDFGRLSRSGLTDASLDIKADAFTPCRNLLFVVIAASYAYQCEVDSIVMGLLTEDSIIFSDQTDKFLRQCELVVKEALGVNIRILTPLREFSKKQVVALAKEMQLGETYSCHAGTVIPCGECISCLEYKDQ